MMFLLHISYLLLVLANASCILDVQSGFLPGRAKPCADDGQNDDRKSLTTRDKSSKLVAPRTFVPLRSTTKLLLDLGKRRQGGANTGKRSFLTETVALLTAARAFYIDFFLTHADKLAERVSYYSEKHLEMRERAISANELLTWAEACTVATKAHPHPWPGWNFSERFADLPFAYRRSVIKDAIGKVRSYLSNRRTWEKSGKVHCWS